MIGQEDEVKHGIAVRGHLRCEFRKALPGVSRIAPSRPPKASAGSFSTSSRAMRFVASETHHVIVGGVNTLQRGSHALGGVEQSLAAPFGSLPTAT